MKALAASSMKTVSRSSLRPRRARPSSGPTRGSMSSAMGWATLRISLIPSETSMERALSIASATAGLRSAGIAGLASVITLAWSAARPTAVCMVCEKTATRTATPSRKPSWRAVLRTPEPRPRIVGRQGAHAGGGEGREREAEAGADEGGAPGDGAGRGRRGR